VNNVGADQPDHHPAGEGDEDVDHNDQTDTAHCQGGVDSGQPDREDA
jgi:hypothetical protein